MLTSVRRKEESLLPGTLWPHGSLPGMVLQEHGDTQAMDEMETALD